MTDCTITREWDGDRLVLRLAGAFDRATSWSLRDSLEREPAPEVVLDFSLVRDFSDLAIAVLAHGLQAGQRPVSLRGLRQHQLRIFRYCGIPADELAGVAVVTAVAGAGAPRGQRAAERP
jgi:anti-anti-sigma regulatory factor